MALPALIGLGFKRHHDHRRRHHEPIKETHLIHIITSLNKVRSKYQEILASTVAGNVCSSSTEQQHREILYLVQYPCPPGCATPASTPHVVQTRRGSVSKCP